LAVDRRVGLRPIADRPPGLSPAPDGSSGSRELKVIGRLARLSLAIIDGAFIAQQADPHVKLANLLEHIPTALVAMEKALSADA
jgi:hypothetical protein